MGTSIIETVQNHSQEN